MHINDAVHRDPRLSHIQTLILAQYLGFALAVTSPVAFFQEKQNKTEKPKNTPPHPRHRTLLLRGDVIRTPIENLFSSAAGEEEGKITPRLVSQPRRVLWVSAALRSSARTPTFNS